METILELRHVNKAFKGFALKDISFSLKRGFIMGFIGPNGAGKSTTIRCLMDLIHPDSGEVWLFGQKYTGDNTVLKQKIGFVYDQDVFFQELTAEKNKQVIAPFYERWDDTLFYRYVKEFQVPLNKKMKTLSKGTKMKFALAVALSHHAELIIMDEPTSGLDPVFRRELLDVLFDVIQDENKAIFFSTHITTDLEKIADYITFLLDGKILFSKEREELSETFRIVKGSRSLITTIKQADPIVYKETSLGFEAFMFTDQTEKLDKKIAFHIERPNLEEIMYYLVKSKKTETAY
ncbi:ABC transporter ATP-binding protein [Sporolactobacillus shoreicorticis]|uniref:ABC transporter ATP-binding protein n=1 Tax=Sporolactobacillus shoreicorticis TaxID=1923877 RepID=A0ABW5RZ91_9BACL|nr:ABC transporter ATP-binding protein [Sporolactobacillus shoreicorticis]MCO7126801.1 ABC transporter ATP-binding protein [Sporolactobacillus shoreicorticis]